MFLLFTCESCGARIKVDAHSQGRRGRCGHCGHLMPIPRLEHHAPASAENVPSLSTPSHIPEPDPASDAPFRLSPPDPMPVPFHKPPVLVGPEHLDHHAQSGPLSEFHLIAADDELEAAAFASPEAQRGLSELAEFQKDQRPYSLADGTRWRFLGWNSEPGPAGWIVVKWRKNVSLILRGLRWIDDWAYLISVPFIVLVLFAILIENRNLVHLGAVVVLLVNYGRFWTDLLAVFVRPFKEGPIRGLAFLVPPYGAYYVWSRWDQFQPTFRRLLTSCVPIALLVLAYGYLPFINPGAKDAKGLPQKAQSGARELIHETRDELKELETKLPALDRPGAPAPRSRP